MKFPAHAIHMDTVDGGTHFYTLDSTKSGIMVTGRLSGCSFVIDPNGGSSNAIKVAHVQPGLGADGGSGLAAQLKRDHPDKVVYGKTGGSGFYGQERYVTIIGVREGDDTWRIFAQKRFEATNTQKIASVYQLYPEHKKL